MNVADEFTELPPCRPRRLSTVPFISILSVQCRLNNKALDLIGHPTAARILVKRSGAVRIESADGNGPNDVMVQVDGTIPRLHVFCRDGGFEAKRYGVRLVDGALEFQLERAPKEVEYPSGCTTA